MEEKNALKNRYWKEGDKLCCGQRVGNPYFIVLLLFHIYIYIFNLNYDFFLNVLKY